MVASLAGAGGTVNLGNFLNNTILTTGENNSSTILGGVIIGLGGLTKIGSGDLTLTAINTYSGSTSISGGTLMVDGTLTQSSVTVDSGATLNGDGTIDKLVTIDSRGTLSRNLTIESLLLEGISAPGNPSGLGKLTITKTQSRHRLGMLALPGSERVGMPANNWIKLGRSSVWVQSYGQIEQTKGNHGNAGIRSETGGISLGGDHEVLKNTYLGFLGGMSTTPFHWQQGRGSGRVKSYYGGVYGTWLSQTGFYADGQLIAGGDNYNSHRNIVYPGVNRKARQSHSGGQFSTDIQAG